MNKEKSQKANKIFLMATDGDKDEILPNITLCYNGIVRRSIEIPTVKTLLAPVDKSSMITLSMIRTYHVFYVKSGIRMLNGTRKSVYGGLILSNIFYLTISSET